MITRADIQTLNIIPGISLEEETPGQPPAYDSRWTIRKSFTDIPLTHRYFAGANKKTLRYELQGDSGANCTATNRKELLWETKYFATPIQVKTFDGESNEEGEHRTIQVIGAGILKMVDDNNHIVMDYYCLLIPNSTGTVISLDKFMRDDRSIVKFQQVGTVYGAGYMKFYDEKYQEINTVAMEERNGIWYTSNPILMPLASAGPTKRNTEEPNYHRINKMVTNLNTTDIDARQFYAVNDPAPSEAPPVISIRTAGVFSNMSKALKQLELWHQGTGHLAPCIMRRTQKCVHGMPSLVLRYGEAAQVGPRQPIFSENYKPGTAYHMDLGFIRGPENLPDMIANGAAKGKHATEGRRGETCCLSPHHRCCHSTTLDIPVENKSPPTSLIDSFLKKNGIGRKRFKITTSPEGMLTRSNRFQQTCESNGFAIQVF